MIPDPVFPLFKKALESVIILYKRKKGEQMKAYNSRSKIKPNGFIKYVVTVTVIFIISNTTLPPAQKGLSMELTKFKWTIRSFERGIDHIARGKYGKAEREFKKCLDKMPRNAYAHFYLSQIYYIKKDYTSALSHIEKAKEFLDFMKDLNAYALKENYKKLTDQTRIINQYIENSYSCTEAAKLKDQRTVLQEKVETLNSWINPSHTSNDPLKSNYCFNHGNILFQLKQYREAALQYLEAIRFNPHHWEAFNNLAGIFYLNKDYKRACQYIEVAEARGAGFNVNLALKKFIYEALGKPTNGILEEEFPGGIMRFSGNVLEGKNSQARFYINTYILFDEETKTAVMIDPGFQDKRIESFITARQLKVKKILNTHGHFDHTGANSYYARLYKVEVMAHEADKFLYVTENKKNMPLRFFLDQGILDIDGLRIKILYTPGHTPGSVCFLFNHHLFTGDTLFKGSIGRTSGNTEGERQKKREQLIKASKEKLMVLPEDTRVYPGHGGITDIRTEKGSNPFF